MKSQMNSIEIIEANLLDFPNNINSIAHSCNTRNIMGAGIAKQIKDRYPEAYEADTKAFNTEYDEDGQYVHWLGKFSRAEITNKNPFILLRKQDIYTHVHPSKHWKRKGS